MRNITYKYKVGDIVVLKPEHQPEVEIPYVGSKIRVGLVKIIDCRDYDGPTYKFEGLDGYYQEACIECLVEEAKDED